MSRKVFPIPAALFLLIFLNSCTEEKIRTYKIATDSSSDTPAAPQVPPVTAPMPPTAAPASSGHVTWKAPADWTEGTPGQFQVASFTTPTGGKVTVSMLPGDGGGIPANINRWRRQMSLEPLPDEEINGQPLKISDSKDEMLLFNLVPADTAPDSNGILAAILPLASESWYFKFNGKVSDMKANGLAFMNFLRTVRVAGVSSAAPPAPAVAPPAPPASPKIDVKVPEGWEKSQGSAMRAASFSVSGADGATADVSVVPLPGDSGSMLDNVNRWRSQVQLAPIANADDPALGTKVDGPAGTYFMSYMVSTEPLIEGKTAAISTAILKTATHTWFFKITGEASLVEANREKFETFVRTATFP